MKKKKTNVMNQLNQVGENLDPRTPEEQAAERAWFDENGLPDYGYLESLATGRDPSNLQRLIEIAGDMNVEIGKEDTKQQIIQKIMSAEENEGE